MEPKDVKAREKYADLVIRLPLICQEDTTDEALEHEISSYLEAVVASVAKYAESSGGQFLSRLSISKTDHKWSVE